MSIDSSENIGGNQPAVPAEAMSDILGQSFEAAEQVRAPDHELYTSVEDVDGTVHEFPHSAFERVESTGVIGRFRILFNTAQEDITVIGRNLHRSARNIFQKRKDGSDSDQ